jgi:hypothetical protein
MFNTYRQRLFEKYQEARAYFIENHDQLIALEKYFIDYIFNIIGDNLSEIVDDYNEASYLYPFWQKYPPDDRGRQPRGDQFPWIEVGEHSIGDKLPRFIVKDFLLRDPGIPTGPDKRFLLKSKYISGITKTYTDAAWLFIDIKSVGPRDDFDHTVMSHNQVSGDGIWNDRNDGVKNTVLYARGQRSTHEFHCSIPPIYILSDLTVAPVIIIVLKPVYRMLSTGMKGAEKGQPLHRITIATIPNGLLLIEKPGYLKQYPSLLYPGKDDKTKNPLKVRCRVDFSILRNIGGWRVQELKI